MLIFLAFISSCLWFANGSEKKWLYEVKPLNLSVNTGEEVVSIELRFDEYSRDTGVRACGDISDISIWGQFKRCVDWVSKSSIEFKIVRFLEYVHLFERATILNMESMYGNDTIREAFNDSVKFADLIMEGSTAGYISKVRALIEIMELPHISTYCETGFNFGHSSLLALMINPRMQVLSFDLGGRFSTMPAGALLEHWFPGANFNLISGGTYTLCSLPFFIYMNVYLKRIPPLMLQRYDLVF